MKRSLNKYPTGGVYREMFPNIPGVYINDFRKIRKTTGKPINPNRDLLSGYYRQDVIDSLARTAIENGVNPYRAIAQGLAETNLGFTDENVGHVLDGQITDSPYLNMINAIKNKDLVALKKGKIKEEDIIQAYNGYGKLMPSTEQKYHGFKSKSFYGVPIPKEGLDMNKNPLYGKHVLDIQKNIIEKSPKVNSIVRKYQLPKVTQSEVEQIVKSKWNQYPTQYEYGGTINNMKRSLKKYDNAGVVSGVGKTASTGANVANAASNMSWMGPAIGLASEIGGALIPDKTYADEEGNNLGTVKGAGEQALEYGSKGAAISAMLGGADFGASALIGAGYGAIKGSMEEKKMREKVRMANIGIGNRKLGRSMTSNVNWGTVNPNTSTNMMFANGGLVLDYDDPNANAELELQETFQMPDGTVGNVDGPSHEMGGIAVDLPEGTRIWSDKLKHNGKTFAKHTKPITNKIAKLEKQLESSNNPKAIENSIMLLNKQLDHYFDVQESNKQVNEMKRTLRNGGMINRSKNKNLNSSQEWEKELSNLENKFGDPKTWTLDSYKTLQNAFNDYKNWKESTRKNKSFTDNYNNVDDYSIPVPEHLKNYVYANGGMIKRADGSYSKRGLWDNIRANKGSGKKPTPEMLKQERKIRAQEKEMGGYIYAEGGIHIKPENKGKFTAYAKSHGKGVQEMAAHIMANKENYSPTIVKRANFARNAAKWKHEMGNYLPMHFDGDVIGNPDRVAVGAMNPRTGQPYTMEDVQVYTKSLGKFPMTFGTQYGGGQKNTNVPSVDNSYSTMYGDYEQNPTMPSSNRKFDYAQSTLGLSPVEPLKNRVQFTPPSEPSESDFMVPEELYRVNAGSQQVRTLNTPLLVDPGKRYTANMNQVTPLGAATLPSPNISRPTREDVGMYNPNADMQTGTPNTSNWLKDNYGTIGQLGSAALSAGIQSGRINRLARPRTLSNVRLSDRMAAPAYVDYSAERNAIDRAALNAMADAQRGFGSSAAAQAFKNKARLNQLEGTGKSFQQQSNVNTQLKNQFLAAQQEAAMREAMINNEIEKYNLENIYGYDTMSVGEKNAITAAMADKAAEYFANEVAFKNRMKQLEMLSKSNYGATNKILGRNGGMIEYAEGGKVNPYKRSLNKVVNFDTKKSAEIMDAEYADALAAGKDKYTSSITGLDYKVIKTLPKNEKRALVVDMWREAHGQAPTQKQIETGVKAIEGKKVTSPKAKTMAEIISSRWKTGNTPAPQMTPEEEKYFLGIKDWGQFGKEQLAQGLDAISSLGFTAIGNPLYQIFGNDLGFGHTDLSPEAVDAMVSNPNEYADAASNAMLGIMGGKALGMGVNTIMPKFYKPAAKYYNAEARNLQLKNAKKVYKANQANRNKRSIANYYQQVPEPDIPRYVRNIAQQEDEVFALDFNKRQKDRLIKKVESKLNVAEGADRFRKPKNLKKP